MTEPNTIESRLNPEQRLAVETTEGPVLVLSGAGTGKTTVLTERLAHIIRSNKALPFQCLAVTFTNKAAAEMTARLEAMIGGEAANVWLGTFHRIGLKILRRHSSKVGLGSDFTILDSSDQERLLKQIIAAEGIDPRENPPALILGQIQRLKDLGLTPEKMRDAPARISPAAEHLYPLYQKRLQTMNAADFGDLLLYCLELFQNNPDILNAFRRQFRYILVDEYQDTNVAQYLWLRLLAGGHNNICCVGDDDQSIYSWRGAEVGNILRFETDFPNAAVIRLESNYRSTEHILGAAAGLISHNEQRLSKTLRVAPGRDGSGEKITLSGVWNGEDEARRICESIEREQRRAVSLKQMAVLVRASFQTRAIEEQLLSYGLPYKVIAGMRFYEREEIRDAIAYIRLLVQPKDDMAFSRVVNKPRRGIGDAALQLIHHKARETDTSLYEAGEMLVREKGLKGAAKTGLEKFYALFEDWRPLRLTLPPDELLRLMLEESGYLRMWREDKSPEAPGKIENLQELIGDVKERFPTFDAFLEHVSLVMDNDAEAAGGEYVSVMTLHAAKGLEFDVVFLPGWEEGLFPHQKSLDEGGFSALEEERRLAYVGLTRARQKVYISFAGSRRVYNQWQNNLPSRFISEIPPEHVESDGLRMDGYAARQGYDYQEEEPQDAYDYFAGESTGGRSRFRDDEYGTPYQDKGYTNAPYSYKNNFSRRKTGFFTSGKKHAFQIGADVYHKSFGHGRVIEADGDSLRVLFDEAGLKKVMADYLESAS